MGTMHKWLFDELNKDEEKPTLPLNTIVKIKKLPLHKRLLYAVEQFENGRWDERTFSSFIKLEASQLEGHFNHLEVRQWKSPGTKRTLNESL